MNGKAVKIKGVNRHEHSAKNGRTLTRAEMLEDVLLNYAEGKCMLNAVIFTIDEKSGRTTAVERINISN